MTALVLTSTSRSEDAGFVAVADIAALAGQLDVDHRLIGGHMVTLLVARHAVRDVPDRVTNDADLGAEFAVVGDPRLIDALTRLGYARPAASNRFIRPLDTELSAVIDLLAPSYTGRHEPNQQHGEIVVDEIPGLGYALTTAPVTIDFEARLTNGDIVRASGRVPAPLPALCLKLLSWGSRFAAKDAEDIWRLLAVCHASDVRPGDWKRSASARDARVVLERFVAINSMGLRRLSSDRRVHARVRALAQAVGGTR